MKKYLLLIIAIASVQLAFGQLGQCTPETSYIDSAVGVYPKPYHPVSNPNGGIDKSACIGFPYQFVFQIVIQDTVNFPGFGNIPIDKFTIDQDGAITNLPAGLDYACNPANCVFEKNTVGCVAIYGTVLPSVVPQDYDLKITGKIYTSGIPISFTFPDANLAPGNFFLTVEPETGTTCYKVSTSEARSKNYYADINPNPVSSTGTLVIYSKRSASVDITLKGVNGAEYNLLKTKLNEGRNEVLIDSANIPNGVYFYKISDKEDFAVGKMVIQH